MAEAKADSAYLDVLESERRRRQDSVRYEIQAKLLELSKDSAIARADRAARARPEVVERIIRVAGDSAAVVEAVAELEAVHEQEVTSLRSALAYADSLLVAERADKAAIVQLSELRLTALNAAREEARRWEASRRSTLLGIPISPTAAFGGGVVVTLAGVLFVVLR